MPDGYEAVTINTRFVQPATVGTQYGIPLIIGTATGYDDAEILHFSSYAALSAVFTEAVSPSIAKCAAALNANGVNQMAVGVYTTNISELYEYIAGEARTHLITSLVVAGFTLDSTSLTTIVPASGDSLIDICDANDIIMVVAATPPTAANNVTPATIAALRSSISSRNVYFVAYNDPAATYDIGGAVLGTIEMVAPQITIMWKEVVTDITKYFNYVDVNTLETAHVNTILLDYGLSASYTTQIQSAVGTNNNDTITDISVTRSIYSLKTSIQQAVIYLRKNTAKLSYTNVSLGLVRATIESTLEAEMIGTGNATGMISSYNITMPTLSSITAADRAVGLLSNVIISVTLAGEIKQFVFSLVVNLGGN